MKKQVPKVMLSYERPKFKISNFWNRSKSARDHESNSAKLKAFLKRI